MIRFLILLIIAQFIYAYAYAHPGGVDADGCHAGKEPYHCHEEKMESPIKADLVHMPPAPVPVIDERTYVRDGDTIVIMGTPVRIKGLSCDELGTTAGEDQKAYLERWLDETTHLEYETTGEKTYDREVGYVWLNGHDLGEVMILNTTCQPCRRYDVEHKYDHLEVDGPVPDYCQLPSS